MPDSIDPTAKLAHEIVTKCPHRSGWHLGMSDVTALLAVAGLIFTAASKWTATEIRGQAFAEVVAKVKTVDKLEWRIDAYAGQQVEIQKEMRQMNATLAEIKETLIRMGFNVPQKKPS